MLKCSEPSVSYPKWHKRDSNLHYNIMERTSFLSVEINSKHFVGKCFAENFTIEVLAGSELEKVLINIIFRTGAEIDPREMGLN